MIGFLIAESSAAKQRRTSTKVAPTTAAECQKSKPKTGQNNRKPIALNLPRNNKNKKAEKEKEIEEEKTTEPVITTTTELVIEIRVRNISKPVQSNRTRFPVVNNKMENLNNERIF